MSESAQQRKVFAVVFVLFLFFLWNQNTLKPFVDGVSEDAAKKRREAAAGIDGVGMNGAGTVGSVPVGPGQVAGQAQTGLVAPEEAPDGERRLAENAPTSEAGGGVAAQQSYSDELVFSSGLITVENTKYRAMISALGGRLVSLKLKGYKESIEDGSESYEAISHLPNQPYPLGVYSGSNSDQAVVYTLKSEIGANKTLNATQTPAKLVLEGELFPGQVVTKVLSFSPEEYKIGVDIGLSNVPADGAPLELEISKFVDPESSSYSDTNSEAFWFGKDVSDRDYFRSIDGQSPEKVENINWFSLSDLYFAQILQGNDGATAARYFGQNGLYNARLSHDSTRGSFSFYALPKDLELLRDMGQEFHRIVNFGWAGFLSAPLLSILHFLNKIFGNYGVAIVALTILVRLAMFPLSAAQFKSMKAMQKLQPEMKRIRESVKDKQDQQMQLMALYQKEKVNPIGGCLPSLLQFPIFLGLYFGIMVDFGLRHAPFAFWIKDLSLPEGLAVGGGFTLPILVILMCLSMVLQFATSPTTMDPMQKKVMMTVMPLMMLFFFSSFPAGLTLYWLTTNIISIGQQRGLHSEKGSGITLTLIVSAAVFVLAFVLAKIG